MDLFLNNLSRQFITILRRCLQINTSPPPTSPSSTAECAALPRMGLSGIVTVQMRYGPSIVENEKSACYGAVIAYSTGGCLSHGSTLLPGHIPCSIFVSIPPSTDCWSLQRKTIGTPISTDGKGKERTRDGGLVSKEIVV